MALIDLTKLDLAFVLDTTSSMSSYITHAKNNINKIAEEIVKSEKCHLRIGLVNYRDHPPQDHTYITQINDFSDDINVAKNFIQQTAASGGGDLPESICCGLNDCIEKLTWRNDAVKVAILIADAPPHGLGCSGDSMPGGCPLKNDPVEIAHKMAEKGITLYCAGCEPALNSYKQFFIALCLVTGGQYVSLDNADNLTNVIVGGTREEISMEKLMAQVHNEVMKEAADKGTRVNEDELTKRIHDVLNAKDSKASVNKLNNGLTPEITDQMKELSKIKTLSGMTKFAKINGISLTNFSLPTSKIYSKKTCITKTPKVKLICKRRTKVTKPVKVKPIDLPRVGLRRSPRLIELENRKLGILKTEDEDSDEVATSPKRSLTDEESNAKRSKPDDKSDSGIDSTNNDESKSENDEENVDMNCARRLAKKTIARNKL